MSENHLVQAWTDRSNKLISEAWGRILSQHQLDDELLQFAKTVSHVFNAWTLFGPKLLVFYRKKTIGDCFSSDMTATFRSN